MDFGLSVLIAMKATFLLLAFAYLRTLGFTLLSLPLLYASLVSMLLSFASHTLLNLPMLLGKNPNGTFPIWSLIMFSPYLYFVRGFSVLQRLWSGKAPYSEICEGYITPEVAPRNVNRAIMAELVKLYKESDLGKRLPSRNLSLSLSLSNDSEF